MDEISPPRIFNEIFKYTNWPVKVKGSPLTRDEVEIKFWPVDELAAVRWFGKHKHLVGKTKFRVMFLYEERGSWVLASILRKVETDREGA